MSLAILFHFLCAQHVSEFNISIIRSLRLNSHTLVVLFLVRCVLEFRRGWVEVVSVLQAEAQLCNTDTTPTQPHRNSNTHRTKNNTTNVVIQQNSRKLLMMDILMSETCWTHKKWNKIASDIKLFFYSSKCVVLQVLQMAMHKWDLQRTFKINAGGWSCLWKTEAGTFDTEITESEGLLCVTSYQIVLWDVKLPQKSRLQHWLASILPLPIGRI